MIANEETWRFVEQHKNDDVRTLALQAAGRKDIDVRFALDQIAGHQAAKRKLPLWSETTGIVFPPHLSMEQCSSEAAAAYKAGIVERLAGGLSLAESRPVALADLTGGLGSDFHQMAQALKKASSTTGGGRLIYAEQNEQLCQLARHNLPLLGLAEAEIWQGDCRETLQKLPRCRFIFIDPARRDGLGRKTYALSDCVPNVLEMEQEMLKKADFIVMKVSPMLDVAACISELDQHSGAVGHSIVGEVHAVAVEGECKELLLVLSSQPMGERTYVATDLKSDGQADVFSYTTSEDQAFQQAISIRREPIETGLYLYEPNAAMMKLGCFGLISHRWGIEALHRNTHLFVSDRLIDRFPGRTFSIMGVSNMNKKNLKTLLQGVERANIAVRNFPLQAAELRKKLHIKDGGNAFFFGITTAGEEHLILKTQKVKN